MDRLEVYLNNIDNVLIMKDKIIPIIRRFGDPCPLWNTSVHAYIAQSFDSNPCYLTETELRRLHKRFVHPSADRLRSLDDRT